MRFHLAALRFGDFGPLMACFCVLCSEEDVVIACGHRAAGG